MKQLRKFTIPVLIGILLLILSACGSSDEPAASQTAAPTATQTSSASTDESFTFQYVCVNRTLEPCKLVDEFLTAVRTRTNGKVDIQLSSYPELGLTGFDMIRLIEDGSVGFGEIYSGFVGGEFPIFDVGNLWGLASSVDEYFQEVDAISDDMRRIIADKTNGGVVVAFNFYPSQFFFTKNPLNSLEDFKGLRTRSHSNVLSDLAIELGAEPQTMAFAEVYTALERGILDGGVTASSAGYGQKWHEVTKYLTGPIAGSFAQTFLTFNAAEWNKLPAEYQQIILEEGAVHTAKNRELAFIWDKEGVDNLLAEGMIHSEFTPEMQAILAEAGEKAVLPAWVKRAGGYDSEAVQLFNDKISSIVGLKVNPDNSVSRIEKSASAPQTKLTSSGLDFTFQYVCVNRTLDPCKLVVEFLDAVRERTDGQVDIQLSSYPELGLTGFDMIRLIEDGSVGFGEIYSGFVGGEFPIFNVGNLWGLFTSAENYFQGVDAISDDMKQIISEKTNGGVTVGFNFYPSNFFFTKNPLNSLDDFKGLRTRSHSNVLSDLVSELGAEPQTMAFAEVYTALERGIIDGGVTCAGCGYGQKWHEVTKYLTGPVPGSFAQTFLTFNASEWNSMPADIQQIILEEGAIHTAKIRAAAFTWDQTGVDDLLAGGMIYSEFTPEMTAILAEAGEKAVLPAWVERAGGYDSEAVQLFNDKMSSIVGLVVNPDNSVSKR